MGMFNVRKPRGFNHQYIYVDERKEKLAKMEEEPSVIWEYCPRKNFLPKIFAGSLSKVPHT